MIVWLAAQGELAAFLVTPRPAAASFSAALRPRRGRPREPFSSTTST